MAGGRIQIEFVKLFQLLNSFQRGCIKRCFPIEGVKDDPFQQISQAHIVILGERLQHFQKALLHADSGLHSFHQQSGIVHHVYQCITIAWYKKSIG